jgi:hypothetical protein
MLVAGSPEGKACSRAWHFWPRGTKAKNSSYAGKRTYHSAPGVAPPTLIAPCGSTSRAINETALQITERTLCVGVSPAADQFYLPVQNINKKKMMMKKMMTRWKLLRSGLPFVRVVACRQIA